VGDQTYFHALLIGFVVLEVDVLNMDTAAVPFDEELVWSVGLHLRDGIIHKKVQTKIPGRVFTDGVKFHILINPIRGAKSKPISNRRLLAAF